jgi:hypothetical protein
LPKALVHNWYLRRYRSSIPGSAPWLIGAEMQFGGVVTDVPRNKVSPRDPRTEAQLKSRGMSGGDRMLHHGYAEAYSRHLRPYVANRRRITLAEFGILQGGGLAIWCDLFRTGRILGLDIDLGHINRNMGALRERGAFRHNAPELYEYDQFLDNERYIGEILGSDKIDVCIDDGFHSVESILTTMKSVYPHLAERFVYFIEDNDAVHRDIRNAFPELTVETCGEMTVVSGNRA